MTDLKDPLVDLVREVPTHVARDDLASAAWAAGRRRRWRRRAAVAGSVAAVLAVLSPAVTTLTDRELPAAPAGDPSVPAVEGYPQRIGHQWWVRELPDRPGPMAGVFYRESDNSQRRDAWVAVSQTGRQWHIPTKQSSGENRPTLSNTGRYLGYFPRLERGPFVIHDLVTGERTSFEEIVPHMADGGGDYQPHVQTPAFWSPNDSQLVMSGISGRPDEELLLTTAGSVRYLRGQGDPIGWLNEDRVAWLERPRERGDTRATVSVTDTLGSVVTTVDLPLPREVANELDQWSAVTSPDGDSVAVLVDDDSFGNAELRQFSLQDGTPTAERLSLSGVDNWCQMSWADTAPLVPTHPDETSGGLVLRAGAAPETAVVAQPSADAHCLVIAASAGAGDPHGGLFGTSTWGWTWWWREILLFALVVPALMFGIRALRRRRGDSGSARGVRPNGV